MMAEFAPLLDSLKCPICLDYADSAMETACCGQIYCEKCVEGIKKNVCPMCKQHLQVSVSRITRRMIGEIPAECPYDCENKVNRSGLDSHMKTCLYKQNTCPAKGCDFIGSVNPFKDHCIEKHLDDLLSAFMAVNIEPETVYHCPFADCQTMYVKDSTVLTQHIIQQHKNIVLKSDIYRCPFPCISLWKGDKQGLKEHIMTSHADDNEWFDVNFHKTDGQLKMKNCKGKYVKMADNGKFYCRTLEGPDTDTSAHHRNVKRTACKKNNDAQGLNCMDCMKLDVMFRNLPYGSLVNGAGHVSTPGQCKHDLDDRYLAKNPKQTTRPVYCRLDTCANSRKFSCGKMKSDGYSHTCKIGQECKQCAALNFVYGIHYSQNDGTKIDKDYYEAVWPTTQ